MDMALREGILNSRADFVGALRLGLDLAAARGCRELCWMDADFGVWPLSDAEVLQALSQWALPHRKLRLLAAGFDDLRARHPRFVHWRQRYDHVVTARQYDPDDLPAGGPQGLMLAPGLFSLRLLDSRSWRAACSFQTPDLLGSREWFDAIEQRGLDSFTATTLGL